jgi:ribosome-binding protein aMBF1 (putative translation factor)
MPNGTSIQRTKTKVATDSASESVAGVSVINAASGNQSLGNDIRALRKSRSLTLQELAEKLQRSVGFVSQLERGLSEPSISDLRNIATIFEVPISLFFGESPGDPLERGFVVRAGSR